MGADLFVAQQGTESILGDRSMVPLGALEQVAAIPGVQRADPVHIHYTVFDLHGQKEFVLLVGSDPGGLGGPWKLSTGRPAATAGEAVLDRTFAEEHDLVVGTEFEMGRRTFRAVGLSEGTRSWMTSLVFVITDTAREMTGGDWIVTYLLVQTDQLDAVGAAIRAETGLEPPCLLILDPGLSNAVERLAGLVYCLPENRVLEDTDDRAVNSITFATDTGTSCLGEGIHWWSIRRG